MQRDMKVGMALGMALVGIVGMLFFRRGPEPKESRPPALQGAAELDSRIAQQSKAPYIHGIEEFVDSTPKGERDLARPSRPGSAGVPGFLSPDEEADHRIARKDASTAVEETSPSSYRRYAPISDDGVPEHNRQWHSTPPEAAPARLPAAEGRAAQTASSRTHTIKPGDTLSALAARYLGSSARYQEIFEANRKILKSPNDLPEGLVIVIPPGDQPTRPADERGQRESRATQVAPVRSRALVDDDQPPGEFKTPSPARRPGKLQFEPVRRSGFSAGRVPPSPAGQVSLPDGGQAPPDPGLEDSDGAQANP